jgi:hypothetical protein
VISGEVNQDISDFQAAYKLSNSKNLILSYISAAYCDYEFTQQAKQIAIISSIDVPPTKTFLSTKQHFNITAADLSH